MIPTSTLMSWKTYQRFPGLNNDRVVKEALTKGGFKFGNVSDGLVPGGAGRDWAKDLFGQKTSSPTAEERIEFVRLSNADLGHPDGCEFEVTCQIGIAMGLELCEPDDAAILRINYQDQPLNEWLIVAMKNFRVLPGFVVVFYVGHGDVGHDEPGLWLYAYYGFPRRFFSGKTQFVFRRPRKSS